MSPWTTKLAAVPFVLVLAVAAGASLADGAERSAATTRISEDIRYLSSDEMEGRGPGTDGLEKAARYIRQRFKRLGLPGAGAEGAYLRRFDINIGAQVVKQATHLVLHGLDGQEIRLHLGEDFQPLAIGGSGKKRAEIIFAGYGISAPKLKYDDYKDLDVKGKVVLIIRREPQQDDETSVFNGTRSSPFAAIRSKTRTAAKAKAAALLLVNDPFTARSAKNDALSRPDSFGTGGRGIPFAHIKQAVVNNMLRLSPVKAGGKKLTSVGAIEAEIDKQLTPMTQPLAGWTADLEFSFENVKDDVSNVAAVIQGEGPLADETVVIGAHYDHLGFGPRGSRRSNVRAVHNGADDNATGTAAIMELARRFSQRAHKPARRMVFIAFTGEERGLLGSNFYLKDPLFPLDKTIAMINIDMIGHYETGGLTLGGVGSATEFRALVERLNDDGALIVKTPSMAGASDHAGFYRKNIPFMFFFTGVTDIYHTPDDDFETIDIDGVVQTIDFAERVLDAIVNMPKRPEFKKIQRVSAGRKATAYLGIVPDYPAQTVDGVKCAAVSPGSPAAKGDLQVGDVIIKLGDVKVTNLLNLRAALQKHKAGDKVVVTVRRGDAVKELDITLGAPGDGP